MPPISANTGNINYGFIATPASNNAGNHFQASPVTAPLSTANSTSDAKIIRLPNGLRIVHERIPNKGGLCSIRVLVNVGSLDDGKQLGKAHALEHFVFLGTKSHPDKASIFTSTDKVAADLNAATSHYYTRFTSDVLGKNAHVPLEAIMELVFHPTLDGNKMKRHLDGTIDNERRRKKAGTHPFSIAQKMVIDGSCNNHPIVKPILGNADTLSTIEPKHMHDFWRNYYSAPNNVVISIAGDGFDLEQITEIAERLSAPRSFPVSREGSNRGVPFTFTPKTLSAEVKDELPDEDKLVHYLIQGSGPTSDTPDTVSTAFIIRDALRSRLMDQIRYSQELDYAPTCAFEPTAVASAFCIASAVKPENFKSSLELTLAEIDKLIASGLNGHEFDVLNATAEKTQAILMDSIPYLATENGIDVLYNDTVYPVSSLAERATSRTNEDITAVARGMLARGDITLAVVGPPGLPNIDLINDALRENKWWD